MSPTNERRRYNVTSSLIGCANALAVRMHKMIPGTVQVMSKDPCSLTGPCEFPSLIIPLDCWHLSIISHHKETYFFAFSCKIYSKWKSINILMLYKQIHEYTFCICLYKIKPETANTELTWWSVDFCALRFQQGHIKQGIVNTSRLF